MNTRIGHHLDPNRGTRRAEHGKERSQWGTSTWWILISLCLGFVWAGIAIADQSGGKLEINRVNPGPVGGNVDVFLTATYADGLAVPGLTAESFSVQVGDGPAAQPTGVTPPSEQLSIVFVMDFTTTVRESGGLAALQDATEDFVKLMQPEDWVGIVKFNIEAGASVERELAPLSAPVVDNDGQSVLYDVIYDEYDGRGTNLNAALKLALDHIDASKSELPDGRTAIVLLGDGEDNYVEFTEEQPKPGETGAEIVVQAGEINVPIFTIGVADVMTGGDGAWLDRMENLADQTGGEFFNATEDAKEAIDEAFGTTSGLLTSEYQLTFAGVDSCDPQNFTVSMDELGLEPASGVFTHRGCEDTTGGSSSGGGGAFGPLGLIAGLSLLALRRRLWAARA